MTFLDGRSPKEHERLLSMSVLPAMVEDERYPILERDVPEETGDADKASGEDVPAGPRGKEDEILERLRAMERAVERQENMLSVINGNTRCIRLSTSDITEVAKRILTFGERDGRLVKWKIWNHLAAEIHVPKGYVLVKTTSPTGKPRWFAVREKTYEIAKQVVEKFRAGDGQWKDDLHPDAVKVISNGYSEEEFFSDLEEAVLDAPDVAEEDVMVDEVALGAELKSIRTTEVGLRDEEEENRKAREMGIGEKTDEIIREIKKMTRDDQKELGLVDGSRIKYNGASCKPVIITDTRNMREMYCPSMRSASRLLGTTYQTVLKCAVGRKKQLGPYIIRYKNWGDAAHVMTGIYKDYLELMQNKADEIRDMSDDEFKRLSSELERMEQDMAEEQGNG